MNNQHFRQLLTATTPHRPSPSSHVGPDSKDAATSRSLGSRTHASIPMTPRTVKGGSSGVDFAKQLAEQHSSGQSQKKFRSSAAPKGTKLASGYRDRARDRSGEADELHDDDRVKRVRALEDAMKRGEIEKDAFEKLRDEIAGGDMSTTHLVKGLDRKLLDRVRRGEDVLTRTGDENGDAEAGPDAPSIEHEFDELEKKDVQPAEKPVKVDREEMGPPPLATGTKRTRDAVIAELKASRRAAIDAKAARQPQLGAKFRKIGDKNVNTRLERDGYGREVLLFFDDNGNVIKRKVRKWEPGKELLAKKKSLPMPDRDAKPLDMAAESVKAAQPRNEEEEEEALENGKEVEDENDDENDIFNGAGTDYTPLADLTESSSSGSDDESRPRDKVVTQPTTLARSGMDGADSSLKPDVGAPGPRNYFGDKVKLADAGEPRLNPRNDEILLGALRKARKIALSTHDSSVAEDTGGKCEDDRLRTKVAALAARDRDLEDLDLGFGSSRFDDADDAEDGQRLKMSEWRGIGAEDEEASDKPKRKDEKPKKRQKKRKGDKNSAADVLMTMERLKNGNVNNK